MQRYGRAPGVYSPIGQSLQNLAVALANRPSQQQVNAQQAQYDLAQTNATTAQNEAAARETLAGMFESGLNGQNYGSAAASAVRSGYKPDDLSSLFLSYMANSGGADADVGRALVGTGKTIGVDDAVSLPHQSQIADRNAGNARQIEAMQQAGQTEREHIAQNAAMDRLKAQPETFAQTRGRLLSENFDGLDQLNPMQRQTIGANPTNGGFQPQNYVRPDGASGTTLDGRTDAATGEPLPQGTQVAPGQAMELTNSNKTAVQAGLMEAQDFTDTVSVLEEVAAADPTIFGMIGNVRRAGQAGLMQLDQLDQMLGSNFSDQFLEAEQGLVGAGVAPDFYDPNLSDIEKLATLTAYKAASAVAAQSGRGLSDKDFQNFRDVIGDPTAWSQNQQSFLSGLQRVKQLVDMRAKRLGTAASGGSLYEGAADGGRAAPPAGASVSVPSNASASPGASAPPAVSQGQAIDTSAFTAQDALNLPEEEFAKLPREEQERLYRLAGGQ